MTPPAPLLRLCGLLLPAAAALPADDAARPADLAALSWNYALFVAFVTVIKVTALVIGYLVVKLGYSTMIAGIKGDDSLEFGALGASFKFKGVTPGLVLGVVGVIMMGWALSTKHQFDEGIRQTVSEPAPAAPRPAKGGGEKAPDFSAEPAPAAKKNAAGSAR